jgi:hypothetical protein
MSTAVNNKEATESSLGHANADRAIEKAKEAALKSTYIPKSIRKNFIGQATGIAKYKRK